MKTVEEIEAEIADQLGRTGMNVSDGTVARNLCRAFAAALSDQMQDIHKLWVGLRVTNAGDHLMSIDVEGTTKVPGKVQEIAIGRACDCGALKARTTHADWCSTGLGR